MALWQRTLAPHGDPLDARREVLRQALLGFRERVAALVQTLGAELPGLTVHDITHLDALWRVADQIAGPDYPINPAEAFVLGGAFLLHDVAHVMAAYPGGISSIKQTVQWQDLIAQRYSAQDPEAHSDHLRTADAAHIDGLRAPWFLFALRQPEGISEDHWRFQAKLGQPMRTPAGELRITSGSAFSHAERKRKAWWLAYDTVCMIDRELRDAHSLMRDEGRPCFAATCVLGVETPEAFARHVRVRDWEPVNVAPKIGDVPKVIAALGGSKLYGDEPWIALRELLQNALDAVRALRALGHFGETEGEVEVRAEPAGGDDWWLHVTDTGIGMSRHVLTNVLLDFGNSLWRSDALRAELPGLAKSGFDAVGQFGIGFYSVFMLGSQVRVTTRRFERSERDDADQWLLTFEDGLQGRPMLARAVGQDRLQRHGTRVSINLTVERFTRMFAPLGVASPLPYYPPDTDEILRRGSELLPALIGCLCPASEVALYARFADTPKVAVVAPNDWMLLGQEALTRRVLCPDRRLVPLRDESGALIGRVGLIPYGSPGALVLHGVRCGELPELIGVALARENNLDAGRTKASVAGSPAAWSEWAAQMLDVEPNLKIEPLLKLHPLVRDHDLRVWRHGAHALTLNDLIARIVAKHELRIHRGEVSHEDDDDMSQNRFDSDFELSDDVVIIPKFRPGYRWATNVPFPWLLGVAPIDYKSRLEAELSRVWGGFEEHEKHGAVVGEVDGIEIYRSVTVYRRRPPV